MIDDKIRITREGNTFHIHGANIANIGDLYIDQVLENYAFYGYWQDSCRKAGLPIEEAANLKEAVRRVI